MKTFARLVLWRGLRVVLPLLVVGCWVAASPPSAEDQPGREPPLISKDDAVALAREWATRLGAPWDIALLDAMSVPNREPWGPLWSVQLSSLPPLAPSPGNGMTLPPRPGERRWIVTLRARTGQVRSVLCGLATPLSEDPPTLSAAEAAEAASGYASLVVGVPADARLSSVQLAGGKNYLWEATWHRYAGNARYMDDHTITVTLDTHTGALRQVQKWWADWPAPPLVDMNVSDADAVPLAKAYLLLMLGKPVGELREKELLVVRPPKEPVQGYGHCGEPSRIAWVVRFTRPIGGHFDEAWVDAEDGTLVGYGGCL